MTYVWVDRKDRHYGIGGLYKNNDTGKVEKVVLIYRTQSTCDLELLFPLVYSHYVEWCQDNGHECLHKMIFPIIAPLQAEQLILENTLEMFKDFCTEHLPMLQ